MRIVATTDEMLDDNKLVSIQQLMDKHKGLNSTMNNIKSEQLTHEDGQDNLKDTLKRIAMSQKRVMSKETKRKGELAQILEDEELIKNVQPTDEETYNNILHFALNMDNGHFGSLNNSPKQRRNGLKQQMS